MEIIEVLETNDYINDLGEKIEIDKIEISSDYIALMLENGKHAFYLKI